MLCHAVSGVQCAQLAHSQCHHVRIIEEWASTLTDILHIAHVVQHRTILNLSAMTPV